MSKHHLARVEIHNFRSCRKWSFELSNFTPLVGYNNAGKSNALSAIYWLLRPVSLSTDDFLDPEEPVTVGGEIRGLDEPILERLEQRHANQIRPYLDGQRFRFRRIQATPGLAVRSHKFEVRDPQVEDEDAEDAWRPGPTGIPQALNSLLPEPILIEAMDDAVEDVTKNKSGTTIAKLLSLLLKPIQERHGQEIDEKLQEIRQQLEAEGLHRPQDLQDFDTDANRCISDLFPGVEVRSHIPAPQIKELFKQGTIKVRDRGSRTWRDVSAMGSGAQRSIQMGLIRQLAEAGSGEESPARTLLLIDEPELYLHPQGVEQVRRALYRLSQGAYQVVFTTHSPLMIHREHVPHTLIVRRDRLNGTHATKRMAEAIRQAIEDNTHQALLLLELSNASQILFADRVIIAEGKTEQRLLPPLFEHLDGQTLGEAKLALVSTGGSGDAAKCLAVLEAMSIRGCAVVDLDYAFRHAVKAGLLEGHDETVQRCLNRLEDLSEEHGICLGEDGLPRNKGGRLNAAEAFQILASDGHAQPDIQTLHEHLRTQRVWLWTSGTIEEHLGLSGKNERLWSQFLHRLDQEEFGDVVDDADGVRSLISWLSDPDGWSQAAALEGSIDDDLATAGEM